MAGLVSASARNIVYVSPRNCSVLAGLVKNLCTSSYHSNQISSEQQCKDTHILESPLGPVKIPQMTLPQYIWKNFEEYSGKPAITCGSSGRSYTYGEARFISNAFARAVVSTIGLKKGDCIGLLMPNIPEYVFAMYGALEAGLVVTFVNPLYTSGEILRQFENAGVKCCVTIPQLFKVAESISPSLKFYKGTVIVGGDSDPSSKVFGFKEIVTKTSANIMLPEVSPSDVALLPYSSGTTGLPKGVMLTHTNCAVNLEQCNHPSIIQHTPTSEDFQERVLSVLPFFHIYGCNGILNTSLVYGLHMISIPKFTPESYIECVLKYKPTVLFVVPSLLLFLASHPSVKSEHLTSIKEVTCGAAPATKSLIEKFKDKVGRNDIIIKQGYGMTETSPVTLFTPHGAPSSKEGSTGQLIKGTRAKVVSLTTGSVLGPHSSGELCIQGPQIMKGYLNNEEATRETIDEHGWLHTGDVAYYDEEGFFYIVDRTKELIKVKGNQVSPTELENIVIQMSGIADVAVVGIPDVLSGEIPRAFVVLRPGFHITEEEIIAFVEPKVAPYKKLAGGVRFLDMIPRNPAGKVLRNELKVFGINVNIAEKS
uniref:Luciferin 4-monooxygenase n=1 Tax=Clastoptera arizonana TaxID=38151 RepID=A0A1B6DDZ7_9HEMI